MSECRICGESEAEHCDMDEPGLDHPSGCDAMHHEFKPKASGDEPMTPTPPLSTVENRTAYRVEVEQGGCDHCDAGKAWTVVGPDDYGIGQTFEVQEDAEDLARLLTAAYDVAYETADSFSASRQQIAQIVPYLQHKKECEKVTPPKHGDWVGGEFWLVQEAEHVCGLQGFGAPGDMCAGCATPPVRRKLNCTCGLADHLSGLTAEKP